MVIHKVATSLPASFFSTFLFLHKQELEKYNTNNEQ